MSNAFERTRSLVHAVIPHEDDPSLVLVDNQGNYPSKPFERELGTYEETFRAIGRETFGVLAFSVQERLPNLPDGIVYKAKPTTIPDEQLGEYSWQPQQTPDLAETA